LLARRRPHLPHRLPETERPITDRQDRRLHTAPF
jgi:hypothetical protein